MCRRQRDLPADSVHALLNQCTITKGCPGRLFPVGERASARQPEAIAGVEDWFPRGARSPGQPAPPAPEPVDISCSRGGALVLALRLSPTTWEQIIEEVTVALEARRIDNVAQQQFNYRVSAPTTTISGPDLTGATLRFDAAAILEGRVQVRVNGALRQVGVDFTLAPDIVTFTAPLVVGDVVNVVVYQEQVVHVKSFKFRKNEQLTGVISSAWENVRFCEQGTFRSLPPGRDRWFTFSAGPATYQHLALSSRLKLRAVSWQGGGVAPAELAARVQFLLATPPYGGVDRALNRVVSGKELSEDFLMVVTGQEGNKRLAAEARAVKEIFPPLQLSFVATLPGTPPRASFIDASAERATVASSGAIIEDTGLTAPAGTIVLGPL